MTRPSVDETLMQVAFVWAQRSTCARAQVGAVIARDGRTLSSGYNGAPAGVPHCDCVPPDDPCFDVDAHCPVSVHSEANAIAFAARYGIATNGATLYSTMTPCPTCATLIINAGIARVVAARDNYYNAATWPLLVQAGIFAEVRS